MVKDYSQALTTLKAIFPHLNRKNEICDPHSPRDEVYNCIAWALGLNDRWVDPDIASGHWWPIEYSDIYTQVTKDALLNVFRKFGFKECASNSPERYFDKVALYWNPTTNTWSHAARVLTDKKFHSKAGKLWDFYHGGSDDALDDPRNPTKSYGYVYQYMKRPKLLRIISLYYRFKLVGEKLLNELRTW